MARGRKPQKSRQRPRPGSPEAASVALGRQDRNAPPDPLEHASAEVDLAEAAIEDPADSVADLEPEEYPEAADAEEIGDAGQAGRRIRSDGRRAGSGGDLPREGSRFGNFLRACWSELQRVQWPDRRQVTQATGVVLGFVIVAGGYLGLADALFSRVIKLIIPS